MVFGVGITPASVSGSSTQDGLLLRYGGFGDEVLMTDGAVGDLRFADAADISSSFLVMP